MDKYYLHTTKEGLKIILVSKKGFVKTYCGIGCKYGSANSSFIKDGKMNKSPYGIAHFIEHQLFAMPNGTDAFSTFNMQKASANAYTSTDKTIYFFTKNNDTFSSLELLIQMYFTPYFVPENVEKEKNIIISEINMYKDNIGYVLSQKGIGHIYPKDDYSYPIIGDEESVLETTVDDLKLAYESFYTPQNSVLCLVGDFDPAKTFEFVDEIMCGLDIPASQTATKMPTIQSKDCLTPITIHEKISQEEVMIFLRMDDITNKDAISCEKILGVLESLFSIASSFYQEMEEKRLFYNDLDYQVITYAESSYVIISAPSKKQKLLAKTIIDKLNELTVADLNQKQIELYLKHLKAKSILEQDSVESLGEHVLSYALEDINYFDSISQLLNLSVEVLEEIVSSIKNSKKTYLISKKVENK